MTMQVLKQKTPISCIWQIRLFGVDFLWGYMKIAEVADMGDENANIVLKREESKSSQ